MHRNRTTSRRGGFTLIEILIVVIILGILAAIVIPQFAGASQSAKLSTLQSNVQTLRSQVALYQIQHNGLLPGGKGGTFDQPTFWNQMTEFTDALGNVNATGGQGTGFPYGPYLQTIPTNPLSSTPVIGQTVIDGAVGSPGPAAAPCAYEIDFTNGTGRVYGVDSGSDATPSKGTDVTIEP